MRLLIKFIPILLAALVAFGGQEARAAATLLPNGEQCFAALAPTSGGPSGTGTGFVGLLGTITGGSGGISGTYGGVALTGGSGMGATANITVSGGAVTALSILNPGKQYVVGDVLSAASANIGNVSGFSVPISSVYINQSLAGGTVAFYIPNTLSFKQTWFNADQATLHQNTNPVQLDANGCAIIYGTGSYRQILQDSLGNTIWDQITTDTSANNNTFWAGLAGGTPNAITVTDAGFNATDGSVIQFIPLNTNTGATTLTPSGNNVTYSIVKDTATGAVALTGGEIVENSPSNVVSVVFSATQNNFHILNLVQAAANATPSVTPQGYLNLLGRASGGPIQSGDVTAATTVYYTPYAGNQIPIWNGSSFSILNFAELTLALNSSVELASTIYDVCVFNNNGAPVAVFGPAWSDSATGAGSRGTGAASAQLTAQNGILVNAVQISANNGTNTYTIPALQCTYVGSVDIDGTAGQVSAYRTWGQSRKFGVWNMYWRNPIVLNVGDSTASWSYSTNTFRPSNNNTANSLTTFTGMPEEFASITFTQQFEQTAGSTATQAIGIGYNSTTSASGTLGATGSVSSEFLTVPAQYDAPPALGINTVTAIEKSSGGTTFDGTQPNMVLRAQWRG